MKKENKVNKETEIIITGSKNWKELRDFMIKELNKCRTKKEFADFITALLYSVSDSEEEMQEKRRELGLPET